MEPYNPNKPFLEFKFDKEKAKEELRNTIPGLRALEYYHQNPDSSITNSLDILAEDFVPFYANTKYGGDVGDYAKEAFMYALPWTNEFNRAKRYISTYPNKEYYISDMHDVYAKTTKGYTRISDGSKVGNNQLKVNLTKVSSADAMKFVDDSKKAYDYFGTHDINQVADVNPYLLDNIDKLDQTTKEMRRTAESLGNREEAIEARKKANDYYNEVKKANILEPGEDLYWDLRDEGIPFFPGRPDAYAARPFIEEKVRQGRNKGNGEPYLADAVPMSMYELTDAELVPHKPYSQAQQNLDKKMLQMDQKLYDVKYGAEDYYVPYGNNSMEYNKNLQDAISEFNAELYGPYPEDLFPSIYRYTHRWRFK